MRYAELFFVVLVTSKFISTYSSVYTKAIQKYLQFDVCLTVYFRYNSIINQLDVTITIY